MKYAIWIIVGIVVIIAIVYAFNANKASKAAAIEAQSNLNTGSGTNSYTSYAELLSTVIGLFKKKEKSSAQDALDSIKK
jgi:hypothetical protein